MDIVKRRAEAVVLRSLKNFRVVMVHGARQSGKTTIARSVAVACGGEYVTLDAARERLAATSDPETFLGQLGTPIVIDEIQRVGEPLVLAVKLLVDHDPRPGRVLMTGSTNFLSVPTISETLAGRVDLVTLWPLAQSEIESTGGDFVDRMFAAPGGLTRIRSATPSRDDYLTRVCRGGFPEVQGMDASTRRRWFTRYVQTVIEREIRAVADLRRGDVLARMARLFAANTAQEHVVSRIADGLGIDRPTADNYRAWLQTVFLIHLVPAWSRNVASKIVHRPKLHMVDTGLAAALVGKDVASLRRPTDPMAGALVETFAVAEIQKQLGWSELGPSLHHYRETNGIEVDIVLEAPDGRVCALEVKTTVAPRPADAAGLATFRDRLDRVGSDFVQGVVLHTGNRRFAMGDRIVALPIADLWS